MNEYNILLWGWRMARLLSLNTDRNGIVTSVTAQTFDPSGRGQIYSVSASDYKHL